MEKDYDGLALKVVPIASNADGVSGREDKDESGYLDI